MSKYTLAEKLLLAAIRLREREKTFSAEDLVVQAWEAYPDSFGLSGYSNKYPDSNRIFTKIMGSRGLRGKGWIKKVGQKQYQVTSKGIKEAAEIAREKGEANSQEKLLRAELRRNAGVALERVLDSKASDKVLGKRKGDVSFYDACGFWDITARSNAKTLNVRLEETEILLEECLRLLDNSEGSSGLKLSHHAVSESDLKALLQAHKDMQKKFKDELAILRKRTDERGASRRRS